MYLKSCSRRVLAFFLTVFLIVGSLAQPGSKVHAGGSANLKDLVIAEVPKLNPNFSSEITSYSGTAYLNVGAVTLYPFKEDAASQVSVGISGKANVILTGESTTVPITTGMNVIEVKVTNGETSKVYTINLNKVDTDYRGRKPIPSSEITASTSFGGNVALMFDKNGETGWSPAVTPTNETSTDPATSFVLDLGKTRWVSRLRADMGDSGYGLWNNMVRISVSTDKLAWTPVITKGNMREDQSVVRYEFGKSYGARYIKYEIIKFNAQNLTINELTVFEDSNGEFKTYNPPIDGDKPFVPSNPNIASGQEIVIEKGLPLSGWMPSGSYGRGTPTAEESHLFGWDGPLFYDPELENKNFMLNNPDALWGLAKAPWGQNGMGNAGEPRDFVPESMKPYIKNAISFCFGDEGLYSLDENKQFRDWMAWSKENYPGTIAHSNQAGGRGWEGNFAEYVKTAKPDLLSFDDYYWHLNNNQWNGVYHCMNTTLWKQQRKAALQGLDGTGNKPILFGQYLDVYDRDQPMSQKNLVVNLSLLTGMKWLNFFRVEYQFDRAYLWDEDGTPTQGLYEWGEVNRYLKTIDDYILLLNNDWVVTKPGQHSNSGVVTSNNVVTDWHMDAFLNTAEKNKEYHIANVEAVNPNQATNTGLPGDVVLGYFKALPGLYPEQIMEQFGCNNPKAFMLLNGLTAGTYGSYSNKNILGKKAGSTENTKQVITLTFTDDQKGQLKKVNRITGVVEAVPVINNTLTVTLGGGEAELYFWDESKIIGATSELNKQPAAFAFDGVIDTYWQAVSAETPVELYTEFNLQRVNQVTINEKADGITGFKLQYREGEQWKDIPLATGTTIGATKTISFSPVNATGIKLVITKASGVPAIKEFRIFGSAIEDTDLTPKTITINDNTMGTENNHFSYDEKWSYRENEYDQGLVGLYEKDAHFSNTKDAVATFQFYGTAVELVFRNNNANGKFSIKLDDNAPIDFSTTGQNGATISKLLDGLTLGNHKVVIVKTADAQAAIDCAKVTYTGDIPSINASKIDTYINNNQIGTGQNQIQYRTTDETEKAALGWAQWKQDMNSNIGYTTSSKVGEYYDIKFYGTDLTIYGGQSVASGVNWGSAEYSVDNGSVRAATYLNTIDSGNNNISVPVLKIHASEENAEHTVRLKVKEGRNRIDYAVASRKVEAVLVPPVNTYTATATAGANGTITPNSGEVKEHEDIVFTVIPNEGYKLESAYVNGYPVTVDYNKIFVIDVTSNITVRVTFVENIPDIVDQALLQSLIDDVLSLNQLNYVGSSWALLMNKVEVAKLLVCSSTATNAERKNAHLAISVAKKSLVSANASCPRDGESIVQKFVDNTSSLIQYNGTWTNGEGAWAYNKYMNSQQISDTASGSSIRFPFTGTGIEVVMENRPVSADLNVKVFKGNQVVVQKNEISCYADVTGMTISSVRATSYSNLNLPYDDYTIELTFTNSSYGSRAALDGFFVTNTGAPENYAVTFEKEPSELSLIVKNKTGEVMSPQAEGNYQLMVGEYTYTASKEGYVSQTGIPFSITEGKVIPVKLVKEEPTIQSYEIKFNVVPSNAQIVVKQNNQVVAPKSDGSYLLLPGEYALTVGAEAYVTKENVTFRVSKEDMITVVLQAIEPTQPTEPPTPPTVPATPLNPTPSSPTTSTSNDVTLNKEETKVIKDEVTNTEITITTSREQDSDGNKVVKVVTIVKNVKTDKIVNRIVRTVENAKNGTITSIEIATTKEWKDLDLSFTFSNAGENTSFKEIVKKETNLLRGFAIKLNHKGVLPANAFMKLYIGDEKEFQGKDSVYLYCWNEKTQKLEELPNNYYIKDKDGYITIRILTGGNFMILPEKANSKITTTLLEQVKISRMNKTLKKGKSLSLNVALPITIVKGNAYKDDAALSKGDADVMISYKTSNKSIASVSKTGKITGKKAGRVTITTTVKLSDGNTKSFLSKITIK